MISDIVGFPLTFDGFSTRMYIFTKNTTRHCVWRLPPRRTGHAGWIKPPPLRLTPAAPPHGPRRQPTSAHTPRVPRPPTVLGAPAATVAATACSPHGLAVVSALAQARGTTRVPDNLRQHLNDALWVVLASCVSATCSLASETAVDVVGTGLMVIQVPV